MRGGDGPFPFGGNDPSGRNEELCRLLECQLEGCVLDRFLETSGIDKDRLVRCLGIPCAPPRKGEGARTSVRIGLDLPRLLSSVNRADDAVLATLLRKFADGLDRGQCN